MVLTDDEAIAKKINSAVFPGLQGGPLMHVIAAKAVALKLAATDEFRSDIERTIANAQVLASTLADNGANVVSGGTDNHLLLLDLRTLTVDHSLDPNASGSPQSSPPPGEYNVYFDAGGKTRRLPPEQVVGQLAGAVL